ncbi:MAG TPA: tRNA (adenosine(37)-N6)-dimethylallyltransferase MiaA [Clostridia bacterium]|nr:tRNA (adenosine(37)-N6)-dimethylallyltransferase MiaA [Clostridia bacterium]
MNKLLIIAGPTATGKTNLALKLACELEGEIVSADSRQVYQGMDIVTGKDLPLASKFKSQNSRLGIKTKKFQLGYYLFEKVPVWLLDIVEPDQKFSAADYCQLAWKVIEDIWQRGKLPIVVGGTGFYIKALLERIETIGIGPDWKLREELQSCTVAELQRILENVDPERSRRMNESDRQNPRRLIRAVEVALASQKGEIKNKKEKLGIQALDRLIIGLMAPYPLLYQRIDQRVEERLKKGAEEEIKKLFDKEYNWGNSVLGSTIGYRQWQPYFEAKASKEMVVQKWKYAEHDYARRQMTWFKKSFRQFGGKWFDISQKAWDQKVEKLVKAWYNLKDAQKD